MPPAREHHRHAVLVGGGDDLRVAHRAAGLHDGGRAGRGHGVEAVAEREERVRGGDRSAAADRGRRWPAPSSPPRSPRRRGSSGPAPIASVRSAPVKITVFDFTCAQTRHAKRSACHSSAVGWRFVTVAHLRARGCRVRSTRAAPRRPRRAPARARRPRIDRSSERLAVAGPSKSADTTRMFAFFARIGRAASSTPGAITASMNVDDDRLGRRRRRSGGSARRCRRTPRGVGVARAHVGVGDRRRRSPRRTDSCA